MSRDRHREGEDRWRRVDRLFRAALELPEAERTEFLEEACGEDEAIREELTELLSAAEGSENLLASLRGAVHSALPDVFGEAGSPTLAGSDVRLGPYRLLEPLGRGGMATVYLAERDDGAFEHRVAVKVLRVAAGKALERRFRAERQVLAGFRHPNIARLLDGGTTPDGRPYLVLEHVDGQPITDYVRDRGLSPRERVELFLPVCEAVQHANQRLVVHRDLKPSNVLVTAEGRVKLLDFGIAKLLADLPALESGVETRTGHYLLTPEYASPEQFRGDPVTAATDVYQLGVLLYELLTGRRPHTSDGRSLTALERVVCRDDPPPLGSVTEAEIPRDLEQVVLMALRKEPDRRYSSADALASDLERFLEGRPVRARGDRWTYRLGKFLRRNRWPVAAGLATLVSLGTFAAVQQSNARRLAAERDRARQAQARAEEIRDFTTDLFRLADPMENAGETVTARELLEAGAERIHRDLTGEPRLRAEMLATMASTYRNLGIRDRALELGREALHIRQALLPSNHPDRAASELQVAELASRVGEVETAEPFREALAMVREAHGSRSRPMAEAYHLAAVWAPGLSREERWALDDSAVAILESLGPEARPELVRVLVESLYPGSRGRSADSIRLWRALEIQRSLEETDGIGVAAILADIGGFYDGYGDWDRAIEFTRRGLEMHRASRGPRHPITLTMTNNLAGMYRDRAGPGDLEAAEELYRELLAVRREITEDPAALAYTLYGLGRVLVERGQGTEAEPYLREILQLEVFPEDDGRHALVQIVLGRALLQQDRLQAAEASLRRATPGSREHPEARRERLQALADLYDRQDRRDAVRRIQSELASLESGG